MGICAGRSERKNAYSPGADTSIYLNQGGTVGLNYDTVSSASDEKKIAVLFELAGVMCRREETMKMRSRNIFCWLKSTRPLSLIQNRVVWARTKLFESVNRNSECSRSTFVVSTRK
ncbi:hypothetical protein GGI35DRAFT_463857 [Trichoderma velutinum]